MSDYSFKPFRFWCQKVLPLVYDDSLSYYELLCKLVKYLNDMLAQLEAMGTDITNLQALYVELRNYLDTQDFESMVSDKLDEMATDGTLEELLNDEVLANILTEVHGMVEDVTFVFVGTGNIGNAVFCYPKNSTHCTIIDTGEDSNAEVLMAALSANGIDTVDNLIISHWHHDHVNGLFGLLAAPGIDFSGCTAYFPHGNIVWSDMTGNFTAEQAAYNNAVSALTSAGATIVYPVENETAEIYGATFKFNNLLSSQFAEYYSNFENTKFETDEITCYNNFCMIVSIILDKKVIVLPADIETGAQANYPQIAAKADLYVMEHHALNYATDETYRNALSPEISILTHYGSDYAVLTRRPTLDRCQMCGTVLNTKTASATVKVSKLGFEILTGKENSYPQYENPLSVGEPIPEGSDLNDYNQTGVYYVLNADTLATIDNAPAVGSGGKLLVFYTTNGRAMNQMFIASSSHVPKIAIRCMLSDGTWFDWRIILFGDYQNMHIKEDWLNADITLDSTSTDNFIHLNNSMLSITVNFTANEDISANTTIITVPMTSFRERAYLNLVDSSGEIYPCRLVSDSVTHFLKINVLKAVPDGTTLYGTVTTWYHPYYDGIAVPS